MIGLSLDDFYYFRNIVVCLDNPRVRRWFRAPIDFPSSFLKLFANRVCVLHQMRGTFPLVMRWCGMNQNAAELREAAANARAFADNIGSAELKRSFREMARRWEAEADKWETKEQMRPAKPLRKTVSPQKH